MRITVTVFAFFLGCCSWNCSPKRPAVVVDISQLSFQEIEALGRNTTVKMSMWQGDPFINAYMTLYVAPELKKRFNIILQVLAWQGGGVAKQFMAEMETGQTQSATDLCWINGENFYQLRQIKALYGPYTQQLPNIEFVNLTSPFIGIDFQQPIDNMECPWGNVQLAIIYDSIRTPQPPRNLEALAQYVRAHPGKFTLPYEFTGMTLLKSWLIALSGNKNTFDGPFDAQKYERESKKLWAFINENKSYFWRNGTTYPESLSQMHQMFADGTIDFTMSCNDGEVDSKILQGALPGSAKAFVPEGGSIQNAHYLGIAGLSGNKAGAMLVANFLISPEAQFQKAKPQVWGDGTVLQIEKLSRTWQDSFQSLSLRTHAPTRAAMQPLALREPAPEYMIRIFEDFKRYIIENQPVN